MLRTRLTFTERRRRGLALKVDRLDRLEGRNAVTPIGAAALGLGVVGAGSAMRGDALIGSGTSTGMSRPAKPIDLTSGQSRQAAGDFLPIPIVPSGSAGGGSDQGATNRTRPAKTSTSDDSAESIKFPTGMAASTSTGISTPWKPVSSAGGGAAMAPRGGTGGGGQSSLVAAVQGRSPLPARPATPAAQAAGASSAALLAAVAGASSTGAAASSTAQTGSVNPGTKATATMSSGSAKPDAGTDTPADVSSTSVSQVISPTSIPNLATGNASGPSQEVFPYFSLYVLDKNDGVVLFPGVDQLATLRGSVELEAQVSGATVSSYSWNTSGISSDATSISGASTNQLSFQWTYDNPTAHVDAITLSVTETSSQIETYTYGFEVPAGDVDGTTEKSAYDNQGDLIKSTDEMGNSTTYSYDALDRQTGSTDALDDITTVTYDADGNVTKVQAPTPAGQTARTTLYAYDSMNQLTTMTDPLGNQTIYGYDADGNQTSAKDPLGRITTTIYDALDRPTVVIDPLGNRTTTTYDAHSNVTQVEDPLGLVTTSRVRASSRSRTR